MLFGINSICHSSLISKQTYQLERVQKRALRIVLGLNYFSYANTLNVCDIDHLSARRKKHSLKFTQLLPKCSRTSKLLPLWRDVIYLDNCETTPNTPSHVHVLRDIQIVHS